MKAHMSAEEWKDLLVVAGKHNHLKPSKPFSKKKKKLISSILSGFNLKHLKSKYLTEGINRGR